MTSFLMGFKKGNMQKSMIEGNTLKLILNFSIPLLLGNLFQQFYNVVDAAIVGQTLGSYALAAVGASSSVQFLILGFCMGICQGFAIMVSQSFGAKRLDEMHTYIYAGAVWTAITAFVVTITAESKQAARPEVGKLLPQVKNIVGISSGKGSSAVSGTTRAASLP